MSALGEYIHLYYSNYKQYGVARVGQQPSFGNYVLATINRRIENEVENIDQRAINELQKRLKLNSQSQLQQSKSSWAKRQQQLIDQIYTLLYERSQKISGVERLYNIGQGNYYITNKNGNTSHILTDSHWAASKSVEELRRLSKQANAIFTEINTLIDKINKDQSSQSLDDLKKLEQLYKQYTHLSYDSNDHTLGAIEKAIGEKRYDGAASNIAGQFGEMFVAVCDDKIFKEANKTVAQIVEQSVKGDEKAEILIDKNLISDNRGDFIYKTSAKDGTMYSLGVTQNKVDVEIQINNQDIFASVKSYSGIDSKSARPDLQQVNLLTTLTFLNNYEELQNIGNHWINMHASHPGKAKSINKTLDDIIKKEIAFQALSSGNPFKQGVRKANAFVFINRSTGQVFVKSVKDILSNNLSTIGGLDAVSNVYLDNHKSNKIQDRITNVLEQIHQCNISVAMNIKFD